MVPTVLYVQLVDDSSSRPVPISSSPCMVVTHRHLRDPRVIPLLGAQQSLVGMVVGPNRSLRVAHGSQRRRPKPSVLRRQLGIFFRRLSRVLRAPVKRNGDTAKEGPVRRRGRAGSRAERGGVGRERICSFAAETKKNTIKWPALRTQSVLFFKLHLCRFSIFLPLRVGAQPSRTVRHERHAKRGYK